MDDFVRDLRERMRGAVRSDRVARGMYATDASIYQQMPVAVASPLDGEDVRAALAVAAERGLPVISRGGGTSLGGQVTGRALILDFSVHMNRILQIDAGGRSARVEPGVVRDDLNRAAGRHGLHFAPDPATTNRATIGGILGNNSSGMRSILYGKAVDHVRETRVALAGGDIVSFRELSPDEYAHRVSGGGEEGRILGRFRQVVETNREGIERNFPKVMRRVGGYNLDEFIGTDRWNLSKVITGSEGTLAVLLDATVNLEPVPEQKILILPHYRSGNDALRALPEILRHRPTAVEFIDSSVINEARSNRSTAPICGFLEGDPGAVLVVELSGDGSGERAERFAGEMVRSGGAFTSPVIADAGGQAEVWEVRRAGLGLVMAIRGDRKPLPFIEDACVPVERLAEYVERIEAICESHGTGAIIYGHASVGVLHIRPLLDLRVQGDIARMKSIGREAFDLVREMGGAWSGEHGDGLVRSEYLEEFFGAELYGAFREVKKLFDPEWLLNPGKIIDAPPMVENLRYRTGDGPDLPRSFYHYRDAGGFLAALEQCSGIGACRKSGSGTMCPSYIATGEEEHSTRGRANALRLAMTGALGPDALTDGRLAGALDLCLACKACKSECPSNVDMARLRSEFLQAERDRKGTSLRDRIVAASPVIASLVAGPAALLVNAVQKSGLFRAFLEKTARFDRRRTPPPFARHPFPSIFDRRAPAVGGRRVVLFDDTYMNFHEPDVGVAATELLESCGYEVVLARAGCCQRPRISHGFLREANRDGEKTLRNLDRFIGEGLPVVVCEPGCASALVDDLPDLVDDDALGARVRAGVFPIESFLEREIEEGRLACEFTSPERRIVIHGHCHQKSLFGTSAMKRILERIDGLAVEEIDSGCCGMAGSFGYEREHYDLSMKVGEDRLFPALRELPAGAQVVACGFSCRQQIRDGAGGVDAVHWVQTLRGLAR